MDIVSPEGRVFYAPCEGKQRTFWDYKGRYGLYGGAPYSGKTDLIRWYPWQQVIEDYERIKSGEISKSVGWALITRRETPLLRELAERCKRIFEEAAYELFDEPAKWAAMDATWYFPTGYRITFGHMQHEDDWQKYQGWELTAWCPDELTTYTEKQFDMMDTWVRQPAGSKLTPIIRSGTNPIGIGLPWVRRRFYEAAKHGVEKVTNLVVEVQDADGKKRKETVRRSQIFIPATVFDNTHVNQAEFIATLQDKPPAIRKALLESDWYVTDGGFVSTLFDKRIHVCKPFKIPKGWYRFRSCWYSYERGAFVSWHAVDPDGNLTVIKHLFLERHDAESLAYRIREIEQDQAFDAWDPRSGTSRLRGVLGPAECWGSENRSGPTIAETMARAGVFWSKADFNRGSADDQIRWRLNRRTANPNKKRKDGSPILDVPGIRWFKTCVKPVEIIPTVTASKANPELPDEKFEGVGSYIELGYACLSRPLVPKRDQQEEDKWLKEVKPFPKPQPRRGYLW